jgi:hypothetical protein
MASIRMISILKGISGKYGNIIFVDRNGKTHLRRKVKQRDPKTSAQREVRGNFTRAIQEWREMAPEERELWNGLGSCENRSGYHYYLSKRMKELKVSS